MDLIEIVILFYFIISFTFVFVKRKQFLYNPSVLFVITQLVMFVGTIKYLQYDYQSDRVHLITLFLGLISFIVGTFIINLMNYKKNLKIKLNSFKKRQLNLKINKLLKQLLVILVIFSVSISIVYYLAVGYNLFWQSIVNFASFGTIGGGDIAGSRLYAYAGDRYFAPGYVNQFKNTILPIIVIVLVVYATLTNRYKLKYLGFFLIPLALLFLLGTGQRGPFVLVSAIVFVFINIVFKGSSLKKINIVFISFAGFFFLLATIFLGRNNYELNNVSGIVNLISDALERFTDSSQLSSVIGFRYIYTQPLNFGSELAKDVFSILPNRRGSTLASDVFQIIYGSTRGTSPSSIWGTIWYDFGLIGVIFLGFFLGIFYEKLFHNYIKGSKNIFRVAIYSGIIIILGTWKSGSLLNWFNDGLITLFILLYLYKVTNKINRKYSKQYDSKISISN